MGCQYVPRKSINPLNPKLVHILICPSEAYQTAIHTLDQYRGTLIVCRYCPPVSLSRSESLTTLKAAFHHAIARVVLGQPHLQVAITGEKSKNPAFIRIDSLDLRNHISWITLDDGSDIEALSLETIQTLLDAKYENLSTRPGWKVVVIHKMGAESIDVVYVWNHPHHDGMGGKIFHQHLLRNLNETFSQAKEPLLNTSLDLDSLILSLPDPTSRLAPNPEILTSWPMTPKFLVKALWHELKRSRIFPTSALHATWAPIQVTPSTTRFRNFTVNNDTVAKVVTACRLHNTTVTGLFHALVLVSLTRELKDTKGFASWTPYDLRQILPSKTSKYPWLEPKETMCNYVSVVGHEFHADLVTALRSKISGQAKDAKLSDVLEIVWSESARVRRQLQARLESGTRNDIIGIMKLVSNWYTQQQKEIRRTRYLSWLVTNLGVLDGDMGDTEDQRGGWSLRRAELLLSADVPSAVFQVSIMTVKGGDMCVACSWQDCVVDLGLGERLMGDLERWLREIGT